MADELVTGKPCLSPWRAQHVSEAVEVSQWEKLLAKLGLTEREALNAIVHDGDIGRSLQRFVRDSARNHFVPEEVLLAVRQQWKACGFPACGPEGSASTY